MYISSLKLTDFRNYEKLDVGFSENFNVIYGANGQGKTNILEALFLCASGRSHRTSKDIELVKFGKKAYYVKSNVERKTSSSTIEIVYEKSRKKKVKINQVPLEKIGKLMGNLNVVMFSPEDLMIIKEGPSHRRRFLDITISQMRPSYFFDLQQYLKILSQRNNLLKKIQEKRQLLDTLDIWDQNLVKIGSKIIKKRILFIKRLSEYVQKNHKNITEQKEDVVIEYKSSVKDIKDCQDINKIEKAFEKTLERHKQRELITGITMCGPHRDDYEILLNGMDIKIYGSQGQQRTAVLSMKLSEIDLMKEETDEFPVLLLDDVMSELDKNRQEFLFNNLKEIQTFITCTDKKFFEENLIRQSKYYNVNNGRILEQNK